MRLCDLSPTGRMLLYFAEQFHPRPTSKVTLGPYDPVTQSFTKYPKPLVRPGRKVPRYMRRPSHHHYGSAPRKLMGSWTAISSPPYFSALAIWPSIGRWTGGGAFKSERDLVINESATGMTPIENVAIPPNVRVSSGGPTRLQNRPPQPTSPRQPTPNATYALRPPCRRLASCGSTGSVYDMGATCSLPAMDASSDFQIMLISPKIAIWPQQARLST